MPNVDIIASDLDQKCVTKSRKTPFGMHDSVASGGPSHNDRTLNRKQNESMASLVSTVTLNKDNMIRRDKPRNKTQIRAMQKSIS